MSIKHKTLPKIPSRPKKYKINFTDKVLLVLAETEYFIDEKMTRPLSLKAWNEKDLADYYHIKKMEKMEDKMLKKRVQKTMYELKKAGCIDKQDDKYRLTIKGWLKFVTWYADYRQQTKKQEMKNKEQIFVVIFDVPEEYKRIRDLLRKALYHWGFKMAQKSVFMTKDEEAFRFMHLLVAKSKIKPFVIFIAGSYLK